MAKLTVTIEEIRCNKTEDDLGADEIYLLAQAAHSLNDPSAANIYQNGRMPEPKITPAPPGTGASATMTLVTRSMNTGDVWTPKLTIIDTPVGPGQFFVGIWLLDQDAAEDVDEGKVAAVSKAIETAGKSLTVATDGASLLAAIIAQFLLSFGVLALKLDGDDLLGFDMVPKYVPAPGQTGFPGIYFPETRWFKATNDGADYDVIYTVELKP